MSSNAIFYINKAAEADPMAFCIVSNLISGWRLGLKASVVYLTTSFKPYSLSNKILLMLFSILYLLDTAYKHFWRVNAQIYRVLTGDWCMQFYAYIRYAGIVETFDTRTTPYIR